eukprot:6489273-Amphidinium_carterae.1
MMTVQLDCRLRSAEALTAKDHTVSYKVGVLGRVACACDSSDILLDWPGAGIHLHIRGRVKSVAIVMTIQRQNFFDVQIDNKNMSLGSSRETLRRETCCLVTCSNPESRDTALADHQIVIRKATEPFGGHACSIHYLDVEVDGAAPNQAAFDIAPGDQPKEVLEVLGDSDS